MATKDMATKDMATIVTREQAIEIATAKAAEMKYTITDHEIDAKLEDGRWIVSFSPAETVLGGGLGVTIDEATGEVLSAKYQQ